jgi:predicted esterase
MGCVESKRAWRAGAVVCALSGMFWGAGSGQVAQASDGDGQPAPSGSAAPPAPPASNAARPRLESPAWINDRTLVFPPSDSSAPRPLVLMLHGMCDAPQNECGYFHQGARDAGYLVCPRANIACGGGGFQWAADPKVLDPLLASSIDAVRNAVDLDEKGDNVLVGFSQGAFRGVDAATRSGVHFSGLVLIAASITPDVARLKAAGVRRVWLTAGDFDGSKNAMIRATKLLVAGGIEAKFVSLGRVGHTFPSDMAARMETAISWVRAAPSAPEATASK